MELWAEMVGCFIYSFLSIACGLAQLNAIVNNNPTLASGPIEIGLSVAFGIIFCVSTSGSVSAGHFNPGITIAFSLYRRFPKWKVPFYIFVQILGGYIACAAVYFAYRYLFLQIEDIMMQRGVLDQLQFTPSGPSGVFAFYLPPGQTLWGAWLNEFIASVTASTTFWAVMDPSNRLVTPRMSTWVAAFGYGVSIWAFGSILNTSRDVGGRLWALTIWGRGASGGHYAPISALTNIAGMSTAVLLYELFMGDSRRVVNLDSLEHMRLMSNQLSDTETSSTESSRASSFIEVAAKTPAKGIRHSLSLLDGASKQNKQHDMV
ncbi:hypothetical protein NP233_g2128 [Leucocoprinus birnbaumii]|uniref:Aquaporin-like protein n=1 Tax=Leucocoprinus birnbaumii TaxID=56174 RepID=A0AAD5VZJ8_9AGAR|nr:hypothetical protein NP233_g2128 [Leucocoprinus birnbaumii]